jgi:hypothetical protein
MKEDILEQIVAEYLWHKGYFVRNNIKFGPREDHPDFVKNKDANHSDIDVLALHPHLHGPERVVAVSCKSWQGGFNPIKWLNAIEQKKTVSGRDSWKGFRELTSPKWSDAFISAIALATGSTEFTYMLAVAHVVGDRGLWQSHVGFSSALQGNPIKVVTFQEMVTEIDGQLTTTLPGTEVGRMLQMFRASGIRLNR